jgi:hypothetical protein
MSGFYDAMAANQNRKAFSLVTTSYPSWLPKLKISHDEFRQLLSVS